VAATHLIPTKVWWSLMGHWTQLGAVWRIARDAYRPFYLFWTDTMITRWYASYLPAVQPNRPSIALER
jgi:hypothetical protein